MHPCGNCNLLEFEGGRNEFRKRFLQNYGKFKSQIEWQIERTNRKQFQKVKCAMSSGEIYKDSSFFDMIGVEFRGRKRESKREIRMWV